MKYVSSIKSISAITESNLLTNTPEAYLLK